MDTSCKICDSFGCCPASEQHTYQRGCILYPQKLQEFIIEGMAKLPAIPEESDKQCAIDCLTECYHDGFTLQDAIRFTQLTEHVSPSLSEEYACKRMTEIADKYPSRQKKKKIIAP